MKNPYELEKLSDALRKLPGVGKRTAERMARALVVKKESMLKEMIEALTAASETLCCCSRCGGITVADENPCALCLDSARDSSVVCVVEDPGDILTIEQAGGYRGRYHALMGRLSPMHGRGIGSLRVESLVSRIDAEKFEEVILALGSDVEGDSTAGFLRDALGDRNVRITRPAMGLPAGGGISYSDELTLFRAINARQDIE